MPDEEVFKIAKDKKVEYTKEYRLRMNKIEEDMRKDNCSENEIRMAMKHEERVLQYNLDRIDQEAFAKFKSGLDILDHPDDDDDDILEGLPETADLNDLDEDDDLNDLDEDDDDHGSSPGL